MTSPHRQPGARARRWLRRLTLAITGTAAGGVLLAGSPATTTLVDRPLALAAAHRLAGRHWQGHPGRTLVGHRVRPGDTVTGLAVRYHAWTRELRSLNHLGPRGLLHVGQHLTIPVVDAAVPAPRHRRHRTDHRERHRERQHARHPWRHAHASREHVRRVVAHTAHRHRVNPRLALAISWQESGWQQRRLSSAGAIGAMQVMPGTGRWMSSYVGRRLNLYGLHDNVTAGVVLLRVLRGETSRRRAIAGYYQGLASVRRRGMYPSTRHYTRNVLALYHRIHGGHFHR